MSTKLPRVIVDTNIFVSYAIRRRGESSIVEDIVQAALDQRFTLLVSAELLAEIRHTLITKPYFAERVSAARVEQLIGVLSAIGEAVPPSQGTYPSLVRDPDDDFLILNALIGRADYIVSGDKHVLELRERLAPIRVRTPKAFSEEVLSLT